MVADVVFDVFIVMRAAVFTVHFSFVWMEIFRPMEGHTTLSEGI